MYGTYCRLNISVFASRYEVIRAARSKIDPKHRITRSKKSQRRVFYLKMLEYHTLALELYQDAMNGV
jgi:hypothetical protein